MSALLPSEPNAATWEDDPEYLRALVEQAGMSQAEVAHRLGIDARTFRRYVLGEVRIPYLVQFACERLAATARASRKSPVRALSDGDLRLALRRSRDGLADAPPASYKHRRGAAMVKRLEAELQRRIDQERRIAALPSKPSRR